MEVKETELSKSLNIIYQPHPVAPISGRQEMVGVINEGTTVREILLKSGVDPRQPIIISLDDRLLTVEEWDTVFPSNGQILNVQATVEGEGGDSNPLQIVLAIALVVVAAALPGLGPALFTIGSTTVTVGTIAAAAIAVGGSLLLTALFPPKTPYDTVGREDVSPTYSLSGGSNQARPYQSMPVVMGTHRLFPDAGSRPYTEYRGEDQYLYQIFHLGLGTISASDWKIGTTPITSFDDYELITANSNGQINNFPGNVDSIAGAALPWDPGWVQRTTSINTYKIGVDIEAIAFRLDDKGRFREATLEFYLEYAVAGSNNWQPAPFSNAYFPALSSPSPGVFVITGSSAKPQRGTIFINVSVGQYDIRIRRSQPESEDNKVTLQLNFPTLKSYQPDNLTYKGQNRIGLIIKASEQLNGVIQQLSATVSASATYWNGTAWVTGQTSNPAHWFAHFARGVYNADGKLMYGIGLTESQLDLGSLHAWAQFCQTEGLTFNAVIDGSQTAADIINIIAKSGFGSPSWASGKLGVVYDARNPSPVMTFGMSNIIRNSFEVAYITEQLSDEIVVRFRNPNKDWEQDEVRVNVPGVTDPLNPAQIELFGCTNANMAGKYANYLAAQQYYRKRRITWQTDFEGFVCQRGDVVLLSHDLTQWGYSGRIVSNNGLTVQLDRQVPRSSGGDYLMLIRPDGQTYTYNVSGGSGDTDTLTLNIFPQFQSGYEPHDHRWCYSPLATPGKKVKIISVAPASDSRLQIVATDEYPEFYTAWGGSYISPPSTTILPGQSTSTSGLTATVRKVIVNGYLVNRVSLSWRMDGDSTYSLVRMFLDGQLIKEIAATYAPYAEIDIDRGGNFYAEVTPYSSKGAGTTQTVSLLLTALDLPLPPDEVRLIIGEDGKSATYEWDEVAGVQSYVIEIYANGVVRRSTNIGNTLSYKYTVDDAAADGGPFRSYEFRVYSVNQSGQSLTYASVTFGNPQIGALQNVSVEPMPNSLWFRCDKPVEPDFAAIRIWLSKTSGYTPADTDIVYDGQDTWVNVAADNLGNPLESGVTYYLRAAAYDTYGDDNLTLTPEFAVQILSPAWGLLQDDIEKEFLAAGLRDTIDLIDTTSIAEIAAMSFPPQAGLIGLINNLDGELSTLDVNVDTIGEKLLETALKVQGNTDLMYDAGVTVDSTTGEVYIYALKEAQNELNEVGIRLDAAESSLTLKASTAYVDQAIAEAVIDPSQIAELDDVYARLASAEIDIDGLQAEITLKADLLLVENQEARLSTAEIDISALESAIVLKADNTELSAVEARVSSAETTLNALDVPSITQTVTDVRYLSKEQDKIATANLQEILTGQANYDELTVGIAKASETLTAYVDENLNAEAAQRLELAVKVDQNSAAIQAESVARANADSAEAAQRVALAAIVDQNTAAISSESIARANADSSLASQITTLDATVGSNTAAILNEATARASADEALATEIEELSAVVDGNIAAIQSESTARATADEAISTQITTVQAQASKERTYRQTTAPTTGMLTGDLWFDTDDNNKAYRYDGTQWVVTDDTRIAANTAAIQTEATARATADESLATQITTVTATANGKNQTYRQAAAPTGTLVSGDLWFDSDDNNKAYRWNGTQWIATDDTRIAANTAAIQTETTARATADSALASQITTIQTTVNGQTTSIQTLGESVDGINAKYTVKIDNNGYVTGYGLISTANNGSPTSSFLVNANRFAISPVASGVSDNPRSPFFVLTSPTVIDGVSIPAGTYIKSVFIHDASITSAKIADASITNAKILNAAINAAKIENGAITSAKIGDAQITTAKIGTAQVDTLRVAGNAITVTASVATRNNISSVSLNAPYGGVLSIIVWVEGGYDNNAVRVRLNGNELITFDGDDYWYAATSNYRKTSQTMVLVVGVGSGTQTVQFTNIYSPTGNGPTVRAVCLLTQR